MSAQEEGAPRDEAGAPRDEAGAHLYFELARITPQILLQIYPRGFFPWYSEGEAIRCFNPATRCILYPPRLYIASRTVRYARTLGYSSARDRDFRGVIDHCATIPRAVSRAHGLRAS